MAAASSPSEQLVVQQASELRPFHSPGSAIRAAHDGRHVICQRNTSDGSSLFVVDTADCGVRRELVQQTEKVTAFAVSPVDAAVYTANKELLLRRWDWESGEAGGAWRSFHRAPITMLALCEGGRRLASASVDGLLRLWDRASGVTRPCRGHSGVLSLLLIARGELFSCDCNDYAVRVWSLDTGVLRGTLAGHQSTVTGLCLLEGGRAVTCGRDQVLILWQMSSLSRIATIPCDESLECCAPAPPGLAESLLGVPGPAHLLTGGQSGRIRLWDLDGRRCALELSRGGAGGGVGGASGAEYTLGSVQCILPLGSCLLVARQAGSVELYSGADGRLQAEWCGSLGEVTCIQCGPADAAAAGSDAAGARLLLVTDSGPFLRAFLWQPGGPPDWRCRSLQLHGESDVLMCCQLLPPGNRLLTGARGGRVRLHRLEGVGSSLAGLTAHHLAELEPGHEGHVTALAATGDGDLAVSACETPVIKVFRVSDAGLSVVAMVTRPHEKSVNCLAVSPNDALLAAGSRDKSVSLWSLPQLRPVGRLLGHRRGVWSVRFCRQQQLLASVSIDCCARVWDLRDLSCQRCLEGDHPLYDLAWLGSGQLVTTDQAGLLRVWSVRDRAPVETREGHTGRALCLAELVGEGAADGDGLGRHWLSGGEDGRLLVWRDATAEAAAAQAEARARSVAQEQRLANLLASGRQAEALALALTLGQPSRARGIVADLVAASGARGRLDPELVRGLQEPLQQRLLEFSAGWNANSRTCYEAQCVLNALLRIRTPAELLAWPEMRRHLPGLLAFTERHERRAQQLAACQYLGQLLAAMPAAV